MQDGVDLQNAEREFQQQAQDGRPKGAGSGHAEKEVAEVINEIGKGFDDARMELASSDDGWRVGPLVGLVSQQGQKLINDRVERGGQGSRGSGRRGTRSGGAQARRDKVGVASDVIDGRVRRGDEVRVGVGGRFRVGLTVMVGESGRERRVTQGWWQRRGAWGRSRRVVVVTGGGRGRQMDERDRCFDRQGRDNRIGE